jgi:hypothetical protein
MNMTQPTSRGWQFPIVLKTLPLAFALVLIKWLALSQVTWNDQPLSQLVEISDLSVVFTGAFFVMALMLTGTMSDFKESEKIPGEVASNLEAIQDWCIMAFRAPRTGNAELSKEALDRVHVHRTLSEVTAGLIIWFRSPQKDSFVVFPLLRRINGLAYYFAERGVDKEAVKGIMENTNTMRKQVSRAYAISKTSFLASAYVLLRAILFFVLLLLAITKFKSTSAELLATLCLSFIFIYLYHLIVGLDDPFEDKAGGTDVELRPLERYKARLGHDLMTHGEAERQ